MGCKGPAALLGDGEAMKYEPVVDPGAALGSVIVTLSCHAEMSRVEC